MSASTAPPYPLIVKGASFLLAWRLEGRRVLLIGGGLVASGRLYYLLEAGAHVTLISPRAGLHPETAYRVNVSNADDIRWLDREYAGVDADDEQVDSYDMVLTAIDDVALSRTVCDACRRLRVPVNVADVPPECDFYFGSQLRRGPLQIMVSTSGRGPKIASLIRKRIEASLPANVERAIENVGVLRAELRKRAPGTGGELGKRRMEWMIGVCDEWDLDELSEMTPGIRSQLLDDGWDQGGRVIKPKEIGATGAKGWWRKLVDGHKEAIGAGVGGLLLGAAIPSIAWYLRSRRR